jgi:UDP-glucose 4-epimerase
VKVLITGGAGFIGSHLAELLLARDDAVLAIDNYATGRRENLPAHPQLTVVEGSIADGELVQRTFAGFRPDVVIHAAASYKDPENWAEDARTNVLGTANVVRATLTVGVTRLIYFQTALCYGLQPLEQPITLKHPIRSGGSSYAISKTAAEQYIELSGAEYISFRLANAYGPRNLSGPLPTFFARLSQRKPCFVMDTRRDFIFIDDLTRVVMQAIDGVGRKGPYHVASGRDFAVKELFDAAVQALGLTLDREVEVRPRSADDAATILLDPSQTNRDFSWQVTTPLAEGVRRAIAWYRHNAVKETYTHLKLEPTKDHEAA